jgi:HdeA/HdeB family
MPLFGAGCGSTWPIRRSGQNRGDHMRKLLISIAAFFGMANTSVMAAYTDANGFLNVQALTCAQLANTWQQDADKLMVWYSGWYNGLAKKHYMDVRRGKELEHEVILYCKANQNIRIIDAIAVVLKDERIRAGIEMK